MHTKALLGDIVSFQSSSESYVCVCVCVCVPETMVGVSKKDGLMDMEESGDVKVNMATAQHRWITVDFH